jgi:prefoldin subunit 5
MVMSYDALKTRTDWDEEAGLYTGPSNKQLREKVETLDREIEWLTTRLAHLSLSDEDFDQTQDYIFELRQERESLKRCFNV